MPLVTWKFQGQTGLWRARKFSLQRVIGDQNPTQNGWAMLVVATGGRRKLEGCSPLRALEMGV